MTALRELSTTVPGLSAQLGDISSLTAQPILTRIAGNTRVKKEALTHSLDMLENSLQQHSQQVMLMLALAQEVQVSHGHTPSWQWCVRASMIASMAARTRHDPP